ncbi:MAG: WbqC family protein [Bacteroidota bacterium]|nr:WbqC family protein [Bacteroidota bacterium]
MTASKIIFPSCYLAPVQWYSKLFQTDEITIEQHEHYVKQTWRNRARIIGANGIQDLIIPVHARNHMAMHEVEINYEEDWQRQHWQSIRSAYGNAPFFEYYADYFSPFYEKKNWIKLVDYNAELVQLTLKLLKLQKKIVFTEEYLKSSEGTIDFRSLISPKTDVKEDVSFKPQRYVQVFEERHGFIPTVSILDLLCCEGPASGEILRGINN